MLAVQIRTLRQAYREFQRNSEIGSFAGRSA